MKSTDYKIFVNPDAAFSVVYEDGQGRLIFIVEIGNDPKLIFLNPKPTENGRKVKVGEEAIKIRLKLAIERIKEHFNAQGLRVQLD